MARQFIPRGGEPEVPSNTLSYFFREAVRRIWVSKRTSFVAIAMIAISLFILGAFLLVAENLERAVEQWQGRSRVNVYFANDATPEQIRIVETYLGSQKLLRKRTFVSRAEALTTFKRDFPHLAEVVDQLDENPFPASFRVEVSPEALRTRLFRDAMTRLRALPGVDEVQFDWDWVARIRRLVGIINVVGVIAGGILGVAAAFTIANVIRLTMLLYREEIEIMRLVGATERIIRGPFLIEGLLQGTIGALGAIALLFGVFVVAQRSIAPSQSMVWGLLFGTFLPWQKMAALLGSGMLAGWIGSWLSVRDSG